MFTEFPFAPFEERVCSISAVMKSVISRFESCSISIDCRTCGVMVSLCD